MDEATNKLPRYNVPFTGGEHHDDKCRFEQNNFTQRAVPFVKISLITAGELHEAMFEKRNYT